MNSTPQNSIGDELAKSSLSDRLTKVLVDEILAGEMQPGQKLPTGQELARRFGVSLTVVRESISSLKADGLIETRQGAGAFVSKSVHQRPFRIASAPTTPGHVTPEQIFELRTGVEMQGAALAAERGTEAQLQAIWVAYDEMLKDVAAGGDGVSADIEFHSRIADATGNPLFGSFLEFLGEHIRDSIKDSRSEDAWAKHQSEVMAEHAAIVEAITKRDPAAAEKAAYQHMLNCRLRCVPRR